MKLIGLFDEINRLKKQSAPGDPLEKLDRAINWRMFENVLNSVFKKGHKGEGG